MEQQLLLINIIIMEDFMENIKVIEGRMQKSVDNLRKNIQQSELEELIRIFLTD